MFESPEVAMQAIEDASEAPGALTARRIGEEAARQFPASPGVQSAYARSLIMVGEWTLADEVIDRAATLNAFDPVLVGARLWLHSLRAEFDEAAELAKKAESLEPDRGLIKEVIDFYTLIGDEEQTLSWALKLVDQWPDSRGTLLTIARSRLLPAEMVESAKRRYLEEYSEWPSALAIRALDLKAAGDLDGAAKLMREAVALAPENPVRLLWLATILLAQGKDDEADSFAQQLTVISPWISGGWSARAMVARNRGNAQEREEYERRAEESAPFMRAFAALHKASPLAAQLKWREAIDLLLPLRTSRQRLVRLGALTSLARCYLYAGSSDELSETATALKAEQGDSALLVAVQARLAQKTDDKEGAIRLLEAGYEQYPGSGRLAATLLYGLRGMRQNKRAKVLAERMASVTPDSPTECMLLCRALYRLGYRGPAEQAQSNARRKFPAYHGWILLDAMGYLDEGFYEMAEQTAGRVHGHLEGSAAKVAERARKLTNRRNPLTWVRRWFGR